MRPLGATRKPFTPIVYADAAGGNDANDGLTFAAAKLTLQAAVNLLSSGGTVQASGTFREAVSYAGANVVRIVGYLGATWILYGSEAGGTGWTADGGGVYHKDIGSDISAVTRVHDTSQTYITAQLAGGYRRLSKDVSTPTTPAVDKFGVSGTTMYVHLNGGGDPNSVLEIIRQANVISMSGTGRVEIHNALVRFSTTAGVARSNGTLFALGVISEYSSGVGFGTTGSAGRLECSGCTGRHNGNDGFNIHGNGGAAVIATLVGCDGSYNEDEGSSPHDDTTLVELNCRMHHNAYGGMTAINNAVVHLVDCEMDSGYIGGDRTATEGAVTYNNAASGSMTNVNIHDNDHRGLYLTSGALVTRTNVTSTNNNGSDVIL